MLTYLMLPLFLVTSACSEKNVPVKEVAPSTTAATKAVKPPPKQTCTYKVKTAKPEWTAYKYTDKAAVGGTFNTYTLSEGATGDHLMTALSGLSIEIDASSVESNNPARNVTIAEQYFAKFAPQSSIKANIVDFAGDNKKGVLKINVNMNGVEKVLPFNYTYSKGNLEANGIMEMMDFNLQAPFDSIHEACKTLHTGPDGVAKTWTEVALKISAEIDEVCSPK